MDIPEYITISVRGLGKGIFYMHKYKICRLFKPFPLSYSIEVLPCRQKDRHNTALVFPLALLLELKIKYETHFEKYLI